MTTNIQRVTLEDTYYVIQLMREAALANGQEAQADKLGPVMDKLHNVVTNAQQVKPATAPSTGPAAEADFMKLLEVSQANSGTSWGQSVNSAADRNRMVLAMANANMPDVDIARQLGMAREEVRLVLNVHQINKKAGDVYK